MAVNWLAFLKVFLTAAVSLNILNNVRMKGQFLRINVFGLISALTGQVGTSL